MLRKISAVALMAAILMATGSVANDLPAFPDFSAKRVKPPKPGTAKRITVQVTPQVPAPEKPVASSAEPPRSAQGSYDWFWRKVSPKASDAGPGRLALAEATLAGATTPVATPRLQHLQAIAQAHGITILTSTVGTQISPALVLAVISVESAGAADAVSTAGAQGLMQLMPATAARFGVADSLVAADNIAGGVKYLNWLMDTFDGDPILVLAGYNAGEGAVRKYEGVPPFPETRDYVPKVLAAFQLAKGLCKTPPELFSDGCVFVQMK